MEHLLPPIWKLKITDRHGTSDYRSVIGTEGKLEHSGHRLEITNLVGKIVITLVQTVEMESSLIYDVPPVGQTMDILINGALFTVKRIQ